MRPDSELPATPEEAREALYEAWCDAMDASDFVHSFDQRADAVVAVARLVLDDSLAWQQALGWAHVWTWDPHGYRCTRCGVSVGLPTFIGLCPGAVPS